MKTLFSLGEIYPSDFLKEGEKPETEKVELKLIMNDNGLVRLEKIAPMNQMYWKYWYRSGINTTMREALKDIVDSILRIQKTEQDNVWLDIACNDGTLLSFVPKEFIRIGIDPADNSFKYESELHAHHIIQDYFSKEVYQKKLGNKKVKIITSIAMFYDVSEPKQFIKDIYDILEDDGIWVMQLSYSPLMIRQMAFDNICHEHIYYYSFLNLEKLLNDNGFLICNVELNNVNGGSFRLYIRKTEYFLLKNQTDIEWFNINSFRNFENTLEIDNPTTWIKWFEKIEWLKNEITKFIQVCKSENKIIWGYGASTKGNTLLQYFGLDNTLIDAIADRNPSKHGLYTIGSNIPINSEEEMRQVQPDYLLILPWHFKQEFIEREKKYLQKGGKMIFPCPEFLIYSHE